MKKTFSYQGKDKTSADLRGALEFAQTLVQALSDGRTEFTLDYDKKETGTTLTLATIPAVTETVDEEAKAVVDQPAKKKVEASKAAVDQPKP